MPRTPPSPSNRSKRPFPLVGRRDLIVRETPVREEASYTVKDPISLQYFHLPPAQYRLLELLDGRRSFEEIHEGMQQPASRISPRETRHMIAELHQLGLATSRRAGQGHLIAETQKRESRGRIASTLGQPFFIKLPGWEPSGALSAIYPLTRWIFSPLAACLSLLLIAASWFLIATHPEEFADHRGHGIAFFSTTNLTLLWITVGIVKLLHELAHGITAKHFGAECHEIGVAFLVFSPCLYCDVSDSWLIERKRERILIAAAGMYLETLLSAIACFAWWFSHPGLFHQMAMNVFVVTTVSTILFNANPLLRYDGYYILSDWLEVPNLRQKADRALWRTIGRLALGTRIPDRNRERERQPRWLAAYGLASLAYRWMIVLGIACFLHNLLEPYGFQAGAWMFASLTVATAGTQAITRLSKALRNMEKHRMSPIRCAFACGILGTLIWQACTVPLPIHGWAPCVIEPHASQTLYATTSGTLSRQLHRIGDHVQSGAPIVTLNQPEQELRTIALDTTQRKNRLDVAIFQTLGDENSMELAERALSAANDRIARERELRDALTVRAPYSGTIIPPRPTTDRRQHRSATDASFSVLDENNLGAYIEPQTAICRIVRDDQWIAVLLLDQAEREQVQVGSSVEIRLDGAPNATLTGRIEDVLSHDHRVATREIAESPADKPTTSPSATNAPRVESALFRATVRLSTPPTPLMDGMHGRARFSIRQPTLAEWLGDYVQRTFRSRI